MPSLQQRPPLPATDKCHALPTIGMDAVIPGLIHHASLAPETTQQPPSGFPIAPSPAFPAKTIPAINRQTGISHATSDTPSTQTNTSRIKSTIPKPAMVKSSNTHKMPTSSSGLVSTILNFLISRSSSRNTASLLKGGLAAGGW